MSLSWWYRILYGRDSVALSAFTGSVTSPLTGQSPAKIVTSRVCLFNFRIQWFSTSATIMSEPLLYCHVSTTVEKLALRPIPPEYPVSFGWPRRIVTKYYMNIKSS